MLTLRVAIGFPFLFGLHAQTIEVTPKRVMTDEAAVIRAAGLQPGERVTIRGELVDGGDAPWTSQAEFVADSQGCIDTSKQAPVSGSYKEVSPMGLVWSMMPASHKTARYQPPRDFGAQSIEFVLTRGGASAHLEQIAIAEGIQRVMLHEGRLRGTLFLPPGEGRHPAVLVLGGSEGGMPARRAAWLASRGYAALALAYFRYDDLPKEMAGIPLEYFGQALNWMARRPEVDRDHIAVMGVSRGAELALQLASTFPAIHAIVAYAPADVRFPACCGFTSVPYAWTWSGRGLAFRRLRVMEGPGESAIEVERTGGPILLIAGKQDHVWDSSSMADSIVARLKQHHFAFDVEELKYAQAGHGAGRPEIVPAWLGATRNPTSGREVELGGTPKGNAESSLDAIPKVLDFLKKSLATRQ